MSIESYLGHFNSEQMQRRFGEKPLSPVRKVAILMAEEAKVGIKDVTKTFEQQGVLIKPDVTTIRLMPREIRERFARNYAGMMAGTTLQTIEDILVEQALDFDGFVSNYNNAVSGTIIPPLERPQERSPERISYEEWREMIQAAKSDLSLSSFFEERYSSLPDKLRGVINNANALPSIKFYVLPGYKNIIQQVRELTGANKR